MMFSYAPPAQAVCTALEPDALERAIDGTHSEFYSFVFIGTVELERPGEIGPIGYGVPEEKGIRTPLDFRVEAALRGDVGPTATVVGVGGHLPGSETTGFMEDEFRFHVGRRYVVVAHRNSDGTFTTNSCTPTRQIGETEARRIQGMIPSSVAPGAGSYGSPRWLWITAAAAIALVAGAVFLTRRRAMVGS
jgi:hypothetical protein